eukprot:TRINITY_DN24091_c0_g1_i1.p1 TRINITY_DN24091_c0_g1~~TRINITY_DN24091_c0_g1_i1.p1  ORF type:complete len:396 (+),score=103.29 TRINITY_DN24091_c0_g1_i1:118-1305(+)
MYACRYGKPSRAGPFAYKHKPDETATRSRLYNMLLEKVPVQEDLLATHNVPSEMGGPGADAALGVSMSMPQLRRNHTTSIGEGSVLEGTGGVAHASAPGSSAGDVPPGTAASTRREPMDLEAQAAAERKERERDRQAFVEEICTKQTRVEVVDWVGKIFTVMDKRNAEDRALEAKNRRRLGRSAGGACSDSGISGTTLTGGGSGTALASAGHKMAAPSLAATQRAPSLISGESLVVNTGQGGDLLSVPERLKCYLRGELPDLKAHVADYVAAKSHQVEKRVEDEMADKFLKGTTKMQVFSGKDNFLRWQNKRRASIQRVLDAEMPKWIWEAVQSWDERKAFQSRTTEVSETDLIYDYLTKRAAHIEAGRLATEIAIFKPLKASYSLPSMWRDKYL